MRPGPSPATGYPVVTDEAATGYPVV